MLSRTFENDVYFLSSLVKNQTLLIYLFFSILLWKRISKPISSSLNISPPPRNSSGHRVDVDQSTLAMKSQSKVSFLCDLYSINSFIFSKRFLTDHCHFCYYSISQQLQSPIDEFELRNKTSIMFATKLLSLFHDPCNFSEDHHAGTRQLYFGLRFQSCCLFQVM